MDKSLKVIQWKLQQSEASSDSQCQRHWGGENPMIAFMKHIQKNTLQSNEEIKNILQSYFIHISKNYNNFLVSDPIFEINDNKVNITIFYYISEGYKSNTVDIKVDEGNFWLLNKDIIKIIKTVAKLHGKNISFDFVKIHYPYLNASVFSKYIFHNSLSNNFLHFQNAIIKYPRFDFSIVKQLFVTNKNHETLVSSSSSPNVSDIGDEIKFRDGVKGNDNETFSSNSFNVSHKTSRNGSNQVSGMILIGIKIQISGRLATERVIPRVTNKSKVFGSLSKAHYIDYATYTGKNYLGSFTIKVWIGQSLYFPLSLTNKSSTVDLNWDW